jgi:DNA-binding transcriptional LysR family regulator
MRTMMVAAKLPDGMPFVQEIGPTAMARPPTARALNAFRQTILTGSVTDAASALGRTQPAVSRLLKELEADAGFALFKRVKGRLVLTPEGRDFFQELQRSFVGFERMTAVAAEIRQGRRGSLRIAAMPAAAASFLPDALAGFTRAFPGTSLELLVQSSVEVARLVQAQQCDLGIIEGSLAPPALVVTRRHSLRCAVVAPRRWPWQRKRRMTLQELNGQPLIALSPDRTALGAQLAASLVRGGIEPRTIATTHLTAAVSALVLQGLGIGIVDEPTAVMHVARGGVARLLDAQITMQLRFVQAAGSLSSDAVRRLISQCDRSIKAHKISA